jgi:lantibiotic leader peptide-processing serine protease
VHYTVVAEDGVSAAAAGAAITRAGGTIVSRNDNVGMFSVKATSGFAQGAIDAPELIGASADRAIGQVPDAAVLRDAVEQEGAAAAAGGNGKPAAAVGADPLNSLQWNMAMVRADAAHGRPPEFDAFCEGGLNFNGFYGFGIVDAFAAVTAPPAWGQDP